MTATASFFVPLAVNDEKAAAGFVSEGFGNVHGPAADGEGKPDNGAVFDVDGGGQDAGGSAACGGENVVAGEVGGVGGGFAEHGGVASTLGAFDKDYVGLEMFEWSGEVGEGGGAVWARAVLAASASKTLPPQNRDIIESNLFVFRDQLPTVCLCLCDEHPVERVGMVMWRVEATMMSSWLIRRNITPNSSIRSIRRCTEEPASGRR